MRLIRLPEVENLVGLKKSTIYSLIERGDFPQQIKISARASAWVGEEVDEWIQSRVEGRPIATVKSMRTDLKAARVALATLATSGVESNKDDGA